MQVANPGDDSSSGELSLGGAFKSLTARASLALIITFAVVFGVILVGTIGYTVYWKLKNGWYSQ